MTSYWFDGNFYPPQWVPNTFPSRYWPPVWWPSRGWFPFPCPWTPSTYYPFVFNDARTRRQHATWRHWNTRPRNTHRGQRYCQPAMWHQRWNSPSSPPPTTQNKDTRSGTMQVDYELTRVFAVDPTVFDDESPGIDFYYPNSGVGISLQPGEQAIVNTHVIVKLPKGMVGVIMDKSSVVTRHQLKVEAGLIDTGYRGEIKIVLRNMSQHQVDISPGQAIAQMLLHAAHHAKLNKVEKIEAETNRGTRGFGQAQQVQRKNTQQNCEIL